jgi:hypothetical protein
MEGVSREAIAEERMWRKRPDGIAIQMPTETKSDFVSVGICIAIKMSTETKEFLSRSSRECLTLPDKKQRSNTHPSDQLLVID